MSLETMTKLASTTVEVGGSANITFTNVPQGYTDLYVKVSARSNRADTNDFLKIYFNGVTTGLTLRNLGGDGSSISTGTDSASFYGRLPGNTATASTFGNGKFYISGCFVRQVSLHRYLLQIDVGNKMYGIHILFSPCFEIHRLPDATGVAITLFPVEGEVPALVIHPHH